MSDVRSRADKLAAMAAAIESPHEAAVAADKLAGMKAWRQARQARNPAALMRLCEIPDCGRKHFGLGLCNPHWQRARANPSGIICGAETFDGGPRRRCTRPARAVRDGLLVCHQHGDLELVRWAGALVRIRERVSRPAIASVPRIAARTVEEWDREPLVAAAAVTSPPLTHAIDGRGRLTFFDTEAVAAEIERDGLWAAIVRHRMSYQHALRIRNGWRPKIARLRSRRIEARPLA